MVEEVAPRVQDYESPEVFLKDWLSFKRRQNPGFSLRLSARRLGFKSHVSLLSVLAGKRAFDMALTGKVARLASLSPAQARYLKALVRLQAAPDEKTSATNGSPKFRKLVFSPKLRIRCPSTRRVVTKPRSCGLGTTSRSSR